MKTSSKKKLRNHYRHESQILSRGVSLIGGTDEVGRGCLAGPVFAAAVVFPPKLRIPGVDDSKKLSPSLREKLYDVIVRHALSWSVASVGAEEIDRINIHHASLKAMRLAVFQLNPAPEFLLVDGRFPVPDILNQKPIIHGDSLSHTIAAASILAKVSRDRLMMELEKEYSGFSFSRHKGYGTKQHVEEIRRHGLTPIHRRSFKCF